MSSVYFYYDPSTAFDRLFGDTLVARCCPSARALSTEVKHATPRHRDAYGYRPKLDLRESKDTNTVTATFELPGLTTENVTIDVQQDRLTVSGGSPAPPSDVQKEVCFVIRERRSGKFSRALQLPVGTKAEDIKARMENGVLTITFPKISPDQQPKHIAVQ